MGVARREGDAGYGVIVLLKPGNSTVKRRSNRLSASTCSTIRFLGRTFFSMHTGWLARIAGHRGTGGGRDNVRDDRGGGAGDVVIGLADGPRGEDVQGSSGAQGDDAEARGWRKATRHPDALRIMHLMQFVFGMLTSGDLILRPSRAGGSRWRHRP